MSVTLRGKNSKFASALSAILASSILEFIEFDQAVISDDGNSWLIYFACFKELTDDETISIEKAVKSIVPQSVNFSINYEVVVKDEPELTETVEPEFIVPDFTDADIPEEDEPVLTLSEDLNETAMDRYFKRQKELSQEAAEKAKSYEGKQKVQKKKQESKLSKDGRAIYGSFFPIKDPVKINTLNEYSGSVLIEGDVIAKEKKPIQEGKKIIFTFAVTDYSSSINCKLFLKPDEADLMYELITGHIALKGKCAYDSFMNEVVVNPYHIISVKQEKKTDNAPTKRIEMHLHTKMSQMDSVVDANQLVKTMLQYGHDTVAITDHGVVQAFTDMEDALAKNKADIKVIFGMEGYLLNDDPVVSNIKGNSVLKNLRYCVYSIRTTNSSALTGDIYELGACIIEKGILQEKTFHKYVKTDKKIDPEILFERNITQEFLSACPSIESVIKEFIDFAKDSILVCHNLNDTFSFINTAAEKCNLKINQPTLDTLRVAREIVPNIKSNRFNKVCDALEIKTGEINDCLKEAEITGVILNRLIDILNQKKIYDVDGLNKEMNVDGGESYHVIMYAQNKTGLFNLYSLVTESHLHHLRRKRPQIPRSSLIKHREGLLIASACEAGELYRAILRGTSDEKLEKIAEFYDFLEVQPLGNNDFLIREGTVRDKEHLIELNKRIIDLGEKLNKPVLATGDVHYLKENDAIFRSIIQCAEGYSDADIQAPLYYRTTEEMLDEFYYLPEEKRKEIVIDNPRMVADMCEKLESFPRDHLYTPEMENADEDLRQMCEENAKQLYGDPLPEIVAKRLERELNSIIKNGYSVLYLIAHKVVKKSLSDGYLVGSRGSVGSSFAATMADITEVNPLQPHYVCPNCKYSDFDIDMTKYDCGIDMPHKNCPKCNTELLRLGFNIPFEVFMGFDGDKVPDIDLNFSGTYQPVVHKYIEELFGDKYVFRAGTIGGVADKTAIGYAKKYCEEYNLGRPPMAEILRMSQGCIDVKRTTGQHAGGVVIVPKAYDINNFTPLQYPANDPSQGIITTHFTFKSLHDTLLKADILGHDDPTVIRMLEDLTGIDAKKDVPLDDPKVMELFLSPAPLGVTEEQIGSKTGTYGIPEFGTDFTRKMLEDTKPTTFSDLVKISGLSHGTDVWLGNAQDLILSGTTTISGCICTREDIMNTLILNGCDSFKSFDTMEKVRKGKGIPEKYLDHIREHGIPEWFIDSCNKIKYMFPKAHAAAYVTMALRIAWFKVYKPHQYYATYFTVRADDFEIGIAQMTVDQIKDALKELHALPSLTAKEKGKIIMLEMVLEMKMRNIEFSNIDIYKSKALDFTVTEDNFIRPPLNAVPKLGETAAKSIVEAREIEPFKSQDDLLARTKLSSTLMQFLEECGCLKDLPKSQQISLFDL